MDNKITEERRNIQRAQRMIGVSADGIFGPQTLLALQSRLLGAAAAAPPTNVVPFPPVAATPSSQSQPPEPTIRLVEGPDRDDTDILDFLDENMPGAIQSLFFHLSDDAPRSFRDRVRNLMDLAGHIPASSHMHDPDTTFQPQGGAVGSAQDS